MRVLFLLGFYGTWLFFAGCASPSVHRNETATIAAPLQRLAGHQERIAQAAGQIGDDAARLDAKAVVVRRWFELHK